MITAPRICAELEAGDMDIRTPLDLRGTAEEAFLWTGALIEQVIERVVQASPVPQTQQVLARPSARNRDR